MPRYDYECENGHIIEEFRIIKDREAAPWCDECNTQTRLIISRPAVQPDWEPFQSLAFEHDSSVSTNDKIPPYFRSKKHYHDELKARGLHIKERGEKYVKRNSY